MKNFIGLVIVLLALSETAVAQRVDSLSLATKSGVPLTTYIKHDLLPRPAVIFYTTYHQGPSDLKILDRLYDKGFAAILVYARGIPANLSAYSPYENEAEDIHQIIDWASKQAWCNGSLGMYGGSYTGFAQWAAVKKVHPALKTIVPQVAVMPGFDTPMENNVPLNLGVYWPHDNIYKKPPLPRSLPFEWFEGGYAFQDLDSIGGHPSPIFKKWLKHPDYDKYWQSLVPTPQEYQNINIPVLSTTGYYDGSQLSTIQYFKLHSKYNPAAEHYLVIGPYDHWGGQRRYTPILMNYVLDSAAHVNMGDLALDWLAYILQGKPKPSLLKDRVNYQIMGANSWVHAPTLATEDHLRFYLDGTDLRPTAPKSKKGRLFTVDMKDRNTQNNFYTPEIVFDSLDPSGGLVYLSQVLDHDRTMAGSFSGELHLLSNKKDMDISLALYEQLEDGRYFFLTRYLGRASYADDPSTRHLFTPGKPVKVKFNNTRFVSKKIRKGSRILILLNTNKHPFEIINYGSGKPVAEEKMDDAGEAMRVEFLNSSFIDLPLKTP
jgi:predicted acyl esterase